MMPYFGYNNNNSPFYGGSYGSNYCSNYYPGRYYCDRYMNDDQTKLSYTQAVKFNPECVAVSEECKTKCSNYYPRRGGFYGYRY